MSAKDFIEGDTIIQLGKIHLAPTWEWCAMPYPGHPHGCPNIGKGYPDCPPLAPRVDEVIDLDRGVWWIGSVFDLAGHRRQMMEKHPNWSERKAGCVYYWQPTVRAHNRRLLRQFLAEHPDMVAFSPEGLGVNVTLTLREVGVHLRWKYPLERVIKGWMVGYPRLGCENHPALRTLP